MQGIRENALTSKYPRIGAFAIPLALVWCFGVLTACSEAETVATEEVMDNMATAASESSPPNLEGIWDRATSTSNIYEYLGNQGVDIPFTALGAERYKNVDVSTNPNGFCLPPGPSRMITGPSPFQIVQGTDAVAILNENHGVYRTIHMKSMEDFPQDILGLDQFMGHSFGRWEGDALVVDTVSIREESWLDSVGLQHSSDLTLTETFERTAPDNIRYTVSYNDPQFFAYPFTLEADYKLQDTEVIEYVCNENEQDNAMLLPTFPNLDLDIQVYSSEQ
jgi:hypothetical protein